MAFQGWKPRGPHEAGRNPKGLQAMDRVETKGSRPVGIQRSEAAGAAGAEAVALEQLLRPARAGAEAEEQMLRATGAEAEADPASALEPMHQPQTKAEAEVQGKAELEGEPALQELEQPKQRSNRATLQRTKADQPV